MDMSFEKKKKKKNKKKREFDNTIASPASTSSNKSTVYEGSPRSLLSPKSKKHPSDSQESDYSLSSPSKKKKRKIEEGNDFDFY